jgi:hypothetical protein
MNNHSLSVEIIICKFCACPMIRLSILNCDYYNVVIFLADEETQNKGVH